MSSLFSKHYMDRLNALKQQAADSHARRTDNVVTLADGMTHSQSMRAQKARAEVAEQIRRETAEMSDAPKPDALEQRRAELAHQLKWASSESERRSLRDALSMYDERLAERKAERDEADRVQRFANDVQTKNVRTAAETLRSAATLYPDVDPIEIERAKAIAFSDEFHDPAHLASMFFAKLAEIEELQYQADSTKSQQKTEATAQAFAESTAAHERTAASKARLDAAKQALGGDDAQQDSV